MKYILIISLLTINIASIHAGNWMSYSNLVNSEYIIPDITWRDLENELKACAEKMDYSSIKSYQELLEKLEEHINNKIEENPEEFSTYLRLSHNQQLQDNADLKSKYKNTISDALSAIVMNKQDEYNIPEEISPWQTVQDEITTNCRQADCSSVQNFQELMKKLNEYLNSTIQETPEALPNLYKLLQNQQFEKTERMQNNLRNNLERAVIKSIYKVAEEKKDQHHIPTDLTHSDKIVIEMPFIK